MLSSLPFSAWAQVILGLSFFLVLMRGLLDTCLLRLLLAETCAARASWEAQRSTVAPALLSQENVFFGPLRQMDLRVRRHKAENASGGLPGPPNLHPTSWPIREWTNKTSCLQRRYSYTILPMWSLQAGFSHRLQNHDRTVEQAARCQKLKNLRQQEKKAGFGLLEECGKNLRL